MYLFQCLQIEWAVPKLHAVSGDMLNGQPKARLRRLVTSIRIEIGAVQQRSHTCRKSVNVLKVALGQFSWMFVLRYQVEVAIRYNVLG